MPSDILQTGSTPLKLTAQMQNARPFVIQQQLMTNWCWAASACSIAQHYQPASSCTQKSLVAQVLNMPICNTATPLPVLLPCNKQIDISVALQRVGHFREQALALEKSQIKQALSGGPICCQIVYPDTGGHYVVVHDCTETNNQFYVSVADPYDGKSRTMLYEHLRTNYRRVGGQWLRTYLTR
jgi:hypothetical protein